MPRRTLMPWKSRVSAPSAPPAELCAPAPAGRRASTASPAIIRRLMDPPTLLLILTPPSPPLLAALAPHVYLQFLERRRQIGLAQRGRAQLAGHLLRVDVARIDAMDDLRPTQMVERPVDGRRRRLERIALA